MDKWYKNKRFWKYVLGILTTAGVLSPVYSETAMKVLQAIIGG